MRHPRLVILSSVLGIAALLATTGCGVAADDVAATVGGTTIPASLVNELATSDAFMTAMTSQAIKDQRVGVVDGGDARQVLSFLIQQQVLAQEVERWGAEVTDQDRTNAQQTIAQQASQLSSSQQALVAAFLADRDALAARFARINASKESDLRAMYDDLGTYWDQVCITAVAVPTEAVPAAQRALARRTKLADLPKRVKAAQVVATPRQCIAVGNLPGALGAKVRSAPRGAVVGPLDDVFPGEQASLWFVVSSRRHLSFDDARDQLAQIAGAMAQQGIAAWLTLKVNQDVTIDPQYGSEVSVDQSGLSVTAPAVPLGTLAAAGAPAAPDGSGSDGSGAPSSSGAAPSPTP